MMTLNNIEVLHLDVGNAKWFEFTTLIQSSDFTVPKSHGLRGKIQFAEIKNELKNIFKNLD